MTYVGKPKEEWTREDKLEYDRFIVDAYAYASNHSGMFMTTGWWRRLFEVLDIDPEVAQEALGPRHAAPGELTINDIERGPL